MTLGELDSDRIKKSYLVYLKDLKQFKGKLSREEAVGLNKELKSILNRLTLARVSPETITYFENLRNKIIKKGYIDGGAWATLKSFKDEIH